MGPAPDLSTYEAAAKATYEPQLQAEQTTAAANHQSNQNTLSTEKSSAGTQYDIQEQTLNDTVKTQAAQISQLYSTRLLGNFSGLQGNDMGAMFSKANQDQTNIETQRTNVINAINTSIANENINYNASTSALTSKYQGLESGAASSAYDSAVKDYNTQSYQQQELGLGYAKLNEAYSKDATSAANAVTAGYGMSVKSADASTGTTGGLSFHGPNGVPVTAAQYAAKTGNNIISILSASTDPTDQAITKKLGSLIKSDPTGASANNQINTWLSQGKYQYIFGD